MKILPLLLALPLSTLPLTAQSWTQHTPAVNPSDTADDLSLTAPYQSVIHFDELSLRPVNGVSLLGVTFHFTVFGSSSADAFFNTTVGPGSSTYIHPPNLEGNSNGILTLLFDVPTADLSFGIARESFARMNKGVSVALYDVSNQLLATVSAKITVINSFAQGEFIYSGAAAKSAVITFPSPVDGPRFAIDDLIFNSSPPPSPTLYVNDQKLGSNEDRWIRFVASSIVPTLLGARTDRLTIASRASWWGLKEGIFTLSNPHRHSTCTTLQSNGNPKDITLGPLDVCQPGMAWQVGLAGIQVPNFTDAQVIDTVQQLWPGRSLKDVQAETARLAGYDPSKGTGAQIVASSGVLQRSWLLRNPSVGLTLVEKNVTAECIDTSHSYCFGTAWKQTASYAPTPDASLRSMSDLRAIFDALSP
jgi:hypothetical protein